MLPIDWVGEVEVESNDFGEGHTAVRRNQVGTVYGF